MHRLKKRWRPRTRQQAGRCWGFLHRADVVLSQITIYTLLLRPAFPFLVLWTSKSLKKASRTQAQMPCIHPPIHHAQLPPKFTNLPHKQTPCPPPFLLLLLKKGHYSDQVVTILEPPTSLLSSRAKPLNCHSPLYVFTHPDVQLRLWMCIGERL